MSGKGQMALDILGDGHGAKMSGKGQMALDILVETVVQRRGHPLPGEVAEEATLPPDPGPILLPSLVPSPVSVGCSSEDDEAFETEGQRELQMVAGGQWMIHDELKKLRETLDTAFEEQRRRSEHLSRMGKDERTTTARGQPEQ
eukprot:g23746.t1